MGKGMTMAAPLRGRTVGKKLEARSKKPAKGLRGQFTRKFRTATAGKTPAEIADLLDVSPDMARKYLGGFVPDMNSWPDVAKRLGLDSWHELFDEPRS